MFILHPQLAADTTVVCRLPLCLVLLANDANYPWYILVPQRENIREIHQLNNEDRLQFLQESCALAEAMEALFTPVKMNLGALGNMVPQLHIHHIARYEDDAAWPKPIWGACTAKAYEVAELKERVSGVVEALSRSGLLVQS